MLRAAYTKRVKGKQLPKVIGFRVSQEEYDRINAAAAEQGISASLFVRKFIAKDWVDEEDR